MPLVKNDKGRWEIHVDEGEDALLEQWHPAYREALPKYLTCFDAAFARTREKSEFEFLLCLLRVRGVQPPGWDPYQTTLTAIKSLSKVHDQIKEQDAEAARHLELWLYGHIVEASEPYELLANLIDVSNGGRYKIVRFPSKSGRPQSPGSKIRQISNWALLSGMPQVVTPLVEVWNREFRNAVFHADYVLHGPEVRTFRPFRVYSHDEVMSIVNRAMAYHDALANLYRSHIASYTEPGVIPVHPDVSPDPDLKAVVIVRKGFGAVGLKDAWTPQEISAGKIPFRVGRFFQDEVELLDNDHTIALLPARPVMQEGDQA